MARHLILIALACSALACSDGCGCDCGSDTSAPVVPESAGGPGEFESTTSEATEPAPEVDRAAALEVGVAEVEAEEDTGPVIQGPRDLQINQAIRQIESPTIQLEEIQRNRLPNRVAPSVAQPQVRPVGNAPAGGVDPDAVKE